MDKEEIRASNQWPVHNQCIKEGLRKSESRLLKPGLGGEREI